MAKAESDLRSILDGGFDPREFPWYEPELTEIPEPAKTLLENYSKIQPGQEVEHVKKVSPLYPEILDRLKSGQKLLDVGCAVGQELRQLVFDGVPSGNLYASDLRQDFYDIGYDLFNDHDHLKAQFIVADIFDDNSDLVKHLTHKIDIVNAASFFHLFNWSQQILVAKQLVGLLQEKPGSLLIGRQIGLVNPPPPENQEAAGKHYRHDPATWKKLWEQVGAETGTKWDVETRIEKWAGTDKTMKDYHEGMDTFKLRFSVRKL
ncbi:hypothetical protein PDIG_23970 [Penicillium digitatum PHI26]|uniref:Methyltransferase domain-containing protein n=2 Tax=Penicillium digitatum TaxID=36651 RepID=K9G356_PEND2|nr:hypothetical protein PDIP_87500 [Penicillium digitatum Pd1]EKV04395.1 hypothetical protein PDIP_87500 [Penicillium digitatum Pd1]EKV15784.1 hypothetical protein PDIG_23970 [Penicillium digitatum PHI26]